MTRLGLRIMGKEYLGVMSPAELASLCALIIEKSRVQPLTMTLSCFLEYGQQSISAVSGARFESTMTVPSGSGPGHDITSPRGFPGSSDNHLHGGLEEQFGEDSRGGRKSH